MTSARYRKYVASIARDVNDPEVQIQSGREAAEELADAVLLLLADREELRLQLKRARDSAARGRAARS